MQNHVFSNAYLETLRKKWADLTSGVENEYVRDYVLPVLLENSLKAKSETLILEDATTTASVETLPKIVLPLVRRVVPALIATEIVSTQPLTGPVGAVFYLDFVYKSNRAGITAGSKMFYQTPFSPDYSTATSQATQYIDGVASRNGFNGVLTNRVIRRGSIRIRFKVDVGGTPTEITVSDDGQGFLNGTVSGVTAVGLVDYNTGNFTVVVNNSTIAAGNYGPSSDKDVLITYDYFVEASSDIGEIGFELKHKAVQAQNKMLKSLWSVQTMGDLQHYWGEDAEGLLVDRMAKEIQLEIDRGIINDLLTAATESGNSQSWTRTPTSGLYPADSAEYIRTFLTKVGIVSSTIYKLSFNAQANFLVVPPAVFGLLQSLPEFTIENVAPQGIAKAGTIAGKYRVYVNVYQSDSTVLVGYQGNDVFDTGYVYAPYIPISFTPTFFDPETMTYKKGVIQRYGKVLIRNYYYGLVNISWS